MARDMESEEHTWTNSTGVLSPFGRDTDNLVAGYPLGTTCTDERLRGLVIMSEDMESRFWSLRYRAAPSSGLLATLPISREAAALGDGEENIDQSQSGWALAVELRSLGRIVTKEEYGGGAGLSLAAMPVI
jgi:hypothetical protein